MEVNLPLWKPVGPETLKLLPLQPVYAMTLDLKKKIRASLDKVAARLTEGLR